MMKGISPFIAVVLLIAIVIIVGSVISTWFTGLIGGVTKPLGPEAEKIMRCGPSVLELSVSGSWQAVDVFVSYSAGTEPLDKFNITFLDADGDLKTIPTTFAQPLTPGDIRVQSDVNLTALGLGTTGTLQEVRVTGFCLETHPVSASCKQGEICMRI